MHSNEVISNILELNNTTSLEKTNIMETLEDIEALRRDNKDILRENKDKQESVYAKSYDANKTSSKKYERNIEKNDTTLSPTIVTTSIETSKNLQISTIDDNLNETCKKMIYDEKQEYSKISISEAKENSCY